MHFFLVQVQMAGEQLIAGIGICGELLEASAAETQLVRKGVPKPTRMKGTVLRKKVPSS